MGGCMEAVGFLWKLKWELRFTAKIWLAFENQVSHLCWFAGSVYVMNELINQRACAFELCLLGYNLLLETCRTCRVFLNIYLFNILPTCCSWVHAREFKWEPDCSFSLCIIKTKFVTRINESIWLAANNCSTFSRIESSCYQLPTFVTKLIIILMS